MFVLPIYEGCILVMIDLFSFVSMPVITILKHEHGLIYNLKWKEKSKHFGSLHSYKMKLDLWLYI